MTEPLAQHPTVSAWLNGIRIMHRAHIEAEKRARRWHRVLGSTAAVLGVISATGIFYNLSANPRTWVQAAAGAVVLTAVALTVIHTYLDHASVAHRHHAAATGYGGLRRELEQRCMLGTVDANFLTDVRVEWTRLDRESLTVPPILYDRVSRQVIGERHQPLPRWWQPRRPRT